MKLVSLVASFLAIVLTSAVWAAEPARVQFQKLDDQGLRKVLVDGREAVVYQYGKDADMVHYFPVNSPSGKPLTIQQTEPYPHHRSFWFADTVELVGKGKASFYNALYSKPKDGRAPEGKPLYRDHIRHVEFLSDKTAGDQGEIGMKILWEMQYDVPVLDEVRQMRVKALGQGQYLLDVTFTVTASYGDVNFLSDAAHYAWPYIRMAPDFSVQKGGKMINSEGGVNQAETHGKPARWIDYSGTVDGRTEGLAFFCPPEGDAPFTWLTRDYGTFGPRRAEPQNGKPFPLKQGASLKRRIGVLVHAGDAASAEVGKRYEEFVDGKL
jgi:hypothetical protein